MASTTTYRRGQVIVVNVPFTGLTGSKPRPAVVDKNLIKGALGTMPAEDLERIESGLRFALGL